MSEANATETALIKVNPSGDPAVLQLQNEAVRLQHYAEGRIILSEEEVKLATEDLSCLSKLKKAIQEKRKEYIDPIATHLAEVNAAFKTIMEPLEAADKITRDKILQYRHELEEKKRQIDEANRPRMEAAILEAKANGTGEISESIIITPSPEVLPKTVTTDNGSASTVKLRKWDVEDISKVPQEYLCVDSVAIGKLVRAGIPAIPGIRIWVEETIRISPRG